MFYCLCFLPGWCSTWASSFTRFGILPLALLVTGPLQIGLSGAAVLYSCRVLSCFYCLAVQPSSLIAVVRLWCSTGSVFNLLWCSPGSGRNLYSVFGIEHKLPRDTQPQSHEPCCASPVHGRSPVVQVQSGRTQGLMQCRLTFWPCKSASPNVQMQSGKKNTGSNLCVLSNAMSPSMPPKTCSPYHSGSHTPGTAAMLLRAASPQTGLLAGKARKHSRTSTRGRQ